MRKESSYRNKLVTTLSLIALLSILALSTVRAEESVVQPTTSILTDKQDYMPEETVTIYGSGFLASSEVQVQVTRPDATVDGWVVTSDMDGSFATTYQLDGITGTYIVAATDGINTASTTFTDAYGILQVRPSDISGTTVDRFLPGNKVYATIKTGGGTGSSSVRIYVLSALPGNGNPLSDVSGGYETESWTTTTNPQYLTYEIWSSANRGSYYVFIDEGNYGKQDNNEKYYPFTVSMDPTIISATVGATAHWRRTFGWSIEKSVTPDTWNLFTGDTGTSEYTIALTKDAGTDEYYVDGEVTVTNTGSNPTDQLSIVINLQYGPTWPIIASATLDLSGYPIIEAGGSHSYSYHIHIPAADIHTGGSYRIVADVTIMNRQAHEGTPWGSSPNAQTTLPSTPTLIHDTIHVTDTNGGSWEFSASGSVNYYKTFTADIDEGTNDNTATITETGQYDDASVTVNCYHLEVTKTAVTSFTRTYEWSIEKSVTPDTWDLFRGDSGTSQYTVSVTKTGYTDSDWAVSGLISVAIADADGNPVTEGPSATINSISDVVSGVGAATVDMGVSFPYTLAAGETLTGTYSATLPDGSDRTNTATATLQNYAYDYQLAATPAGTTDFSGSADVIFSNPTTEVNKQINVDDTNGGSWLFSDTGSVQYTRTFTADADEGTHDNTATIRETSQSDSASVTVNCYALEVSKDAATSFTRTYSWTIDKSADQTELHLAEGEQFLVNYAIEVDATFTDSDWAVEGSIEVYNPAPIAATINSITDVVSPDIAATLDFGPVSFPYTLAAGATLTGTYSASLPNADSRTNTATVTIQNYDSDGTATASGTTDFSGTADVDFSSATMNKVDESIAVSDTFAGSLGTVTYGVDTLPKRFEYSRMIGPYNTIGEYTVENTASFLTDDTGATDSDSWTVTVYVEGGAFCMVTSKGYQEFDWDTSTPGRQFRLIFTPDVPTYPGYSRLTASNPGQFSYNIFYNAQDGDEEFTISIPYPFVTQGANPVHIYNAAPNVYTPTGEDITSQFSLGGVPISITSYSGGTFGSFATLTVTDNGYTGPLYITIHLDYGLKKLAGGYTKNTSNDALENSGKSLYATILNNGEYEFSVSGAFIGDDKVYNMNVFKHDPGIGGLVLDNGGNPLANVKVVIYVSGSSKPLGTVYTDADGWYMLTYKWTGKAVTFTVKLPDLGIEKTGTLKANGFVVVNFQIP